jgi:hydrogenase expression/formation protein HypC
MCLGELAEVLQLVGGSAALVRSEARTVTVSLLTLDDEVATGDWVVCHSGFALSRLTPEEAREAAAIRATPQQPRL